MTKLSRTTAGPSASYTIIGSGGVRSGADAYRKIRLGATLVQLYPTLIYQ